MMNIKIFFGDDPAKVEQEINAWMRSQKRSEIVSVMPTTIWSPAAKRPILQYKVMWRTVSG